MKFSDLKLSSRARTLLVYALIPGILFFLSFLSFFSPRALGAWGDDSAGYIYLAGRLFHQAPLIFQGDIPSAAIDFFGDEKLARWAIPTHHQYISPEGVAASKYPLGLSLLMFVGAFMMRSAEGFFIVQPLTAALTIMGVYYMTVLLFKAHRFHVLIAAISAVFTWCSGIFIEAALSQPMREIPGLCFLVWSIVCVLLSLRVHARLTRFIWIAIAGALCGIAIDIRETLFLAIPALCVLVWVYPAPVQEKNQPIKRAEKIRLLIVAAVCCVIALAPLFVNAILISEQKVPFKKRDTGSIVLLSNIGHVQTIDIENAFNNQGKFRAGEGALYRYLELISKLVPIPLFGFVAGYGLFRLFQHNRKVALVLLCCTIPIFGIYALWINPYARYIIPLVPFVCVAAAYAIVHLLTVDLRKLYSRALPRIVLGCGLLIALVYSLSIGIQEHGQTIIGSAEREDRGLARQDVDAIYQLDEALDQEEQAKPEIKPFLLFTGRAQFGLSETFDAYTGRMSYRFPLDQRFTADSEKVKAFFAESVFPEYTVFALIDSTTSRDFYTWSAEYTVTPIVPLQFTFQSGTTLVRIDP